MQIRYTEWPSENLKKRVLGVYRARTLALIKSWFISDPAHLSKIFLDDDAYPGRRGYRTTHEIAMQVELAVVENR